jgi:DNA-directed RNA polymerase subunit RPC12/RpoP
MTIKFKCGGCGQKLSTDTEKAGTVAPCPKCGAEVTVPSSSPDIKPQYAFKGHMKTALKFMGFGLLIIVLVFIRAYQKSQRSQNSKERTKEIAQQVLARSAGDEKKVIAEVLLKNSKDLNLNLPLMIDSETRLDVTLAVGTQMHCKYTLVNTTSKDVDSTEIRKMLEANIIKTQRADRGAVILLKAGVEYYYHYSDKNGVLIVSIPINKSICGIE